MTKANAVNLLKEPDFRNIVAYWLMKAARNVHNELGTEPSHAERLVMAKKIEENVNVYVDRFGWRCVLNATIQGRANLTDILANDSDIEFVVNSEYNNFI